MRRPNFRLNSKSCYYLPVCRCQRTSQALRPAVGLDSGISSLLQTQNGRCCLNSLSMVGVAGFEPATLRLSSACSNQLSYTPNGKKWWRHGDSNPRPIACKATALPTELCPQKGLSGFEYLFPLPDASGIEAKTELCATVSETLSLRFFRCEGL